MRNPGQIFKVSVPGLLRRHRALSYNKNIKVRDERKATEERTWKQVVSGESSTLTCGKGWGVYCHFKLHKGKFNGATQRNWHVIPTLEKSQGTENAGGRGRGEGRPELPTWVQGEAAVLESGWPQLIHTENAFVFPWQEGDGATHGSAGMRSN